MRNVDSCDNPLYAIGKKICSKLFPNGRLSSTSIHHLQLLVKLFKRTTHWWMNTISNIWKVYILEWQLLYHASIDPSIIWGSGLAHDSCHVIICIYGHELINSLRTSDAIWRHKHGSAWAPVLTCCPMPQALPRLMLIYHHKCSLAFIWDQIQKYPWI